MGARAGCACDGARVRDRRSLVVVVILCLGATGLCVCCGVPAALYVAIPQKPDEPAWERCGLGERSVRGIAVARDGRIWAATEAAGRKTDHLKLDYVHIIA